jgi:Kef-type K+ transport system membrane component KefB
MHNVEALGYSVFVPVFFVSIGLDVSFENFKSQLLFIIVFTLIAVVSKLLGGFTGSKLAGFSTNSSWMVGAGMVSRGEMALIVLQIGYQAGLIDPSYYSPFVIIILLSTVIAPLLLEFFTKKVYP